MRVVVGFLLSVSLLYGIQKSDKLFECTEIFKQRKSELLVELERIDEQKQALESLKVATEELLRKKEIKLSQLEEEVNEKLDEVKKREANIKAMLEENKKTLAQLKSTKMDQVAQTYAKMKPGAAAAILSDMDVVDAAKILQALKPKVIGKILSKMDPKKGSQITQLLAE